ncbi:unnamed protein product [Mycena citricolor]|uniref:Uncharacterized protein n=1 Tax=Mycena citricolor TaxID=2018698 RepID=A0AAD2H8D1_9AGAR|nr:unnamed protein product [Mycena citricolor]
MPNTGLAPARPHANSVQSRTQDPQRTLHVGDRVWFWDGCGNMNQGVVESVQSATDNSADMCGVRIGRQDKLFLPSAVLSKLQPGQKAR